MDFSPWLCGPPPSSGQKQRYPSRFIHNLKKYYPYVISNNTLHMFSGSSEFGITTDKRNTGANLVCDYEDLPMYFSNKRFDHVIADPPYADFWQKEWGGKLPKPKRILDIASQVTKPDGLILILHIIVIPDYKEFNVKRIALHPIFCGPNNSLRCLNVFQKGGLLFDGTF